MVVAGLLIFLISAMLAATLLVIWRSRPATIAARRKRRRQHAWALVLDANLKRIAHLQIPSEPPSPSLVWQEKDANRSTPSTSTINTHPLFPAEPSRAVLTYAPHVSQLAASTLSVLLFPTSTMPVPLDRARAEGKKGNENLEDGLTVEKPQPIAFPGRPISMASAYWFT